MGEGGVRAGGIVEGRRGEEEENGGLQNVVEIKLKDVQLVYIRWEKKGKKGEKRK